MDIPFLAQSVRKAALDLASTTLEERNQALASIASLLWKRRQEIFTANQEDLIAAKELPLPLQKRLILDEKKLQGLLDGLKSLEALPDPLGMITRANLLDEGLELLKITCPIGVIGVIFEARPDALVQIASLCLKSGNGVLLKGGIEALRTNKVLASLLSEATQQILPAGCKGWLQLLESREEVAQMLTCKEEIDLLIPRGSNQFVQYIMKNTEIPVMGHADGLCHGYVDSEANLPMAVRLCVDAKTQAVAVCNAMETLLVHAKIARDFLPMVTSALREKQVEVLGCPICLELCPDLKLMAASESDWDKEYLDYRLSIKIVDSLDEAIDHINHHSSHHTEMIVTEKAENARRFMSRIDSADLFWNASTRFADGYRFGLGAEVGISTGKLHARGPVGLEGLCTTKWLLKGKGQCVAPYEEGKTRYRHQNEAQKEKQFYQDIFF